MVKSSERQPENQAGGWVPEDQVGERFDPETGELVEDTRLFRKTLTMKTVQAVPEMAVVAKKPVVVARFWGVMFGTEEQSLAADANKPDDNKQWFTAIKGQCNADVYLDGGASLFFIGGFTYMPGGFQEYELGRWESLNEDEQAKGMPFDVQIAAVPASNPRGYSYLGRSLLGIDAEQLEAQTKLALAHRVRGEDILLQAAQGLLPGLSGPLVEGKAEQLPG